MKGVPGDRLCIIWINAHLSCAFSFFHNFACLLIYGCWFFVAAWVFSSCGAQTSHCSGFSCAEHRL